MKGVNLSVFIYVEKMLIFYRLILWLCIKEKRGLMKIFFWFDID